MIKLLCYKCKAYKNKEDFHEKPGKRGKSSYCKVCRSEARYQKIYNKNCAGCKRSRKLINGFCKKCLNVKQCKECFHILDIKDFYKNGTARCRTCYKERYGKNK